MNIIPADKEQAYEDLRARIAELETLAEDNLQRAMIDLKKALMANPEACSLMLPEEIGSMVAALRKITGQHAATEANKPKGRAAKKSVPLSEAEMQAAWDDL